MNSHIHCFLLCVVGFLLPGLIMGEWENTIVFMTGAGVALFAHYNWPPFEGESDGY